MPELRLDQVHGQPVVRELGGVRVPEGVRMDALLDPGAAGEPLAEHAHVGGRYRLAPERAEDRRPPIDPPLRPDVEPPLHDGKRPASSPMVRRFPPLPRSTVTVPAARSRSFGCNPNASLTLSPPR